MKCGYCGVEFTPKVHNQGYCSKRCKRDQENARKREFRAELINAAGATTASKKLAPVKDGSYFMWPDTHYPYQDDRAVAVALNALAGGDYDEVVILGDFMDTEGVSRWPKAPTKAHGVRMQEEIDAAKEGLCQIRAAAPNAKIRFIGGNHEYRLERYLMERSPELWGLRDLEISQLLRMHEQNIEYTAYENTLVELAPGFLAMHGQCISGHSAGSAQKEVAKWHSSGVSGHTHRLGVYYQRTFEGYRAWMECGYLGSWSTPGCQPSANWQQGFGTVHVIDGFPHMEPHQIVGYKTRVNGVLYKA